MLKRFRKPPAGRASERLYGWLEPPVLAVAAVAAAAGFGQFAAVAVLGDVARHFGEVGAGDTLAERAGLSATTMGMGLAMVRLASLASLPLAGLADRRGRRATTVTFCLLGLGFVAGAGLSPGFWWLVGILAVSRPLLSATSALAQVSAAEQTPSRDRARALAVVAAAYGVGAGLVPILRGVAGDLLGFRGVFLLALGPLAAVAWLRRWVTEPVRFAGRERGAGEPLPVLGAVPRRLHSRLVPLLGVTFAVAVITGPANSFLFVYVENVLGLSTWVTAAMVVSAAGSGLAGLLAGRWGADRLGRRVTAAVALATLAVAATVTYGGTVPGAVAGYLVGVAAGSAFAPAAGALAAELFPTRVRATVSGWLVAAGVLGATTGLMVFGAIADAGDRFGAAALAVFLPVALAGALLRLVPETRGRELEEWDRVG